MLKTAFKPNDWASSWHLLTGFKSVKQLGGRAGLPPALKLLIANWQV